MGQHCARKTMFHEIAMVLPSRSSQHPEIHRHGVIKAMKIHGRIPCPNQASGVTEKFLEGMTS